MMFRTLYWACFGVGLLSAFAADALGQESAPADLVAPRPETVDAQIVGGWEVDPAHWRATRIFTDTHRIELCTATVIGAHVVLTAAHCIKRSEYTVESETGAAPPVSKLHCERHRDWQSLSIERRAARDWALCWSEQPFKGFRFEWLSAAGGVQPNTLAGGRPVKLIGFGCTDPAQASTAGAMRQGNAMIERLPTLFSQWLLVKGDSSVCKGDSGSAAYVIEDAAERALRTDINRDRGLRIIGVASRRESGGRSTLTPTYTAEFRKFLTDWIARSEAELRRVGGQSLPGPIAMTVCGFHENATGCRME